MDIKVLNTGFGDCNIFQDAKNNSLTIDYGSQNTSELNIIDYISMIKPCDVKDAVLTHYHDDHFSGYIESFKHGTIYDTFYLPEMMPDSPHLLNPLVQTVFLSFFTTSKSYLFKLSSKIIEFLNLLPSHTTKIKFIRKSSKFVFDKKDFHVLWPEIGYISPNTTKIKSNIDKLYELVDFEVKDVLNRFLNKIHNLNNTLNNANDNLEEEYNDISIKIRKTISANVEFERIIENVIRSSSRLTSSNFNAYSVVFHCIDEKKEILMLGDIEKSNFENNIVTETKPYLCLLKKYKVIKISHHGTDDYFSKKLPEAENIIINNGSKNRTNWKISALYNKENLFGKFSNVFCTNNKRKTRCLVTLNNLVVCKNNCCSIMNVGHISI